MLDEKTDDVCKKSPVTLAFNALLGKYPFPGHLYRVGIQQVLSKWTTGVGISGAGMNCIPVPERGEGAASRRGAVCCSPPGPAAAASACCGSSVRSRGSSVSASSASASPPCIPRLG